MKAITVPRLSDVSDEVVLTAWRKDVGDEISDADVVAEVETDKAVMEIVADASGVLLRQVVDIGARLSVGDVIAFVDSAEESAARPAPGATVPSPEPLDSAAPDRTGPVSLNTTNGRRRPPSSPLARRLATEHGVDISALHGTGPGGASRA